MKTSACFGLALAALTFVSCRGSAPEQFKPLQDEGAWSLEDHRAKIIGQSCPEGNGSGFEMSVLLTAEPVALGEADAVNRALPGLDFLAGWALSAAPGSFGGLSGLKVMPSGDLLAISDAGALVKIGFNQDAVNPTGRADISFFRDARGDILTGKAEADAEGLELSGDIVLVSFERHHRVLAFAYGVCGSNAKAVSIAEIPAAPPSLGTSIRDNSGAEALAWYSDRLLIGLESVVDRLGPVAAIDAGGEAQFAAWRWLDGEGLPLVGLDAADDTLFSLHRAYNPLTGNSILIAETSKSGTARPLGRISKPLKVDNFEGIAVLDRPDGERRIFIIADDNFSDSQQTLLFAFRVRPGEG